MKTCSDCLYYEECQNRYSWLDQEDNTKYITCEKFKNKADFVEVVRCKDCDVPHNEWTGCPRLNGLIPPHNHYCACGTPKERGGEK